MPLAAPQRLLDALVRQRGHGEAGMGDAEPRHFLGQDDGGDFDSLPFGPGLRPVAGAFEAFAKDQLMNFTHALHEGSNVARLQFGLY